MRKIYIYSLRDPMDNQIRYVGKTEHINKRLWEHINETKNKILNKEKLNHKNSWINSLLKNNLSPILEILEITQENNWKEREQFFIKEFKENGFKLTNSTKGGDSCNVHSCKRVAKIDYITNSILEIFNSLSDAAYSVGAKSHTRISACCNGTTNTSNKFKWKFLDENGNIIPPTKKEFISKKVGKFDLEFNLIEIYPTLYSTPNFGSVGKVCNGENKSYKEYIWRYLNEDNSIIVPKIKYKNKTIAQYTKDGQYIKTYLNANVAGSAVNITPDLIIKSCKSNNHSAKGFLWKYNDY